MPECPECQTRETVRISAEQFECLKCGEVFVVPNDADEDEQILSSPDSAEGERIAAYARRKAA